MRQQYIRHLFSITPEEQALLDGGSLDMGRYNRNGNAVMDPGTPIPDGRLFGIRPTPALSHFRPIPITMWRWSIRFRGTPSTICLPALP